MPINKNYLALAILTLCLVAPAADATNGYMSHGYGITSKSHVCSRVRRACPERFSHPGRHGAPS